MPAPRILECTACRDLFATADRDSGFARWGQGESVRLINNPAVWGADRPRFSLLGFSKGDTQNKAMAQVKAGQLPLEAVPFKGMRKRLENGYSTHWASALPLRVLITSLPVKKPRSDPHR